MDPSKGINSTEFWMFVATGIVMVANGTPHISVPWDQFTIWIAATGLYAGLRTGEKVIAHRNIALPIHAEPMK